MNAREVANGNDVSASGYVMHVQVYVSCINYTDLKDDSEERC